MDLCRGEEKAYRRFYRDDDSSGISTNFPNKFDEFIFCEFSKARGQSAPREGGENRWKQIGKFHERNHCSVGKYWGLPPTEGKNSTGCSAEGKENIGEWERKRKKERKRRNILWKIASAPERKVPILQISTEV